MIQANVFDTVLKLSTLHVKKKMTKDRSNESITESTHLLVKKKIKICA